jgi:hypothetical protein
MLQNQYWREIYLLNAYIRKERAQVNEFFYLKKLERDKQSTQHRVEGILKTRTDFF